MQSEELSENIRLDNLFEDENQDGSVMAYRQLTDSQEKILALLPIPSAILSVLGSAAVIAMSMRICRSKGSWNAYHALLVGIGITSILSSITLVAGSFLYPKESSNQVWAFGNDTTCTSVAFMNQFSITSALLYHAMLGVYFVLKTKFGFYSSYIKVRFEPMMHMVAVLYPLGTAFLGLFFDAYGERAGAHGCWIETCPFNSALDEREECINPQLDWFFRDSIVILVLVFVIFSSLFILLDLRRKIEHVETKKQAQADQLAAKQQTPGEQEDIDDWSTSSRKETLEDVQAQQSRLKAKHRLQLRLVRAQADIYICGFIICNFASLGFRYLVGDQSSLSYIEEMEIPYKYYTWMVLQAILLPLNGFFNMLILVMPHYMKNRVKYPDEPRSWAVRRAIFGSSFLEGGNVDEMSATSKTEPRDTLSTSV